MMCLLQGVVDNRSQDTVTLDIVPPRSGYIIDQLLEGLTYITYKEAKLNVFAWIFVLLTNHEVYNRDIIYSQNELLLDYI